MTPLTIASITIMLLAAAMLYASVGHAGASGYLAVMAIFAVTPEVMKPTALVLNILVATIAFTQFYRRGSFSWSIFWPFAITSIPFSFIGGVITLPGYIYKPVVGMVLLFAAFRLFRANSSSTIEIKSIPLWAAMLSGLGIGLLSGLTGTGGGIFLSPLLLFMGWAETRQTSGVSAAFILVNSIAGLLGHVSSVANLPTTIPIWATAAVVGGFIGSEFGSKRFGSNTLKRLLAVVLVIAGIKIIFT